MEGSIIYQGFTLDVGIMLAVSVLLLCISALVSGSEVAFFSLTARQKSEMEDNGDSRDGAILSLLKDVDELLATI
ncbi:MAG: DUF21 domain-containing protein, partial [Alistipes sp.]|nr:DUF21 domain-containing protein [Alistipes sp.]